MDQKKALSFVFIITAIIIGTALFKDFDFQQFRFKKPALALIYFIGFTMSLRFIIRKEKIKK